MAMLRRKVSFDKSAGSIINGRGCTVDELMQFVRNSNIQHEPLDVERLAISLGLDVRYEPLSSDVSGSLSKESGGYVVVVNSLHHPNRQRFTLAHEIGHYCLHRSQKDRFVDEVFFRDETRSPMEMEANRFAAELLMPEHGFRDFVHNQSSKVEALADRFGVSSLAIRYRAKQLGFTGHGL